MVAYGYTDSWKADGIVDWFSAIDGFIQCDGYAGYSSEVEDDEGDLYVPVPDERRLGCGMHIRSKFHAAMLSKDRRAGVALKLIAELYQIDREQVLRSRVASVSATAFRTLGASVVRAPKIDTRG